VESSNVDTDMRWAHLLKELSSRPFAASEQEALLHEAVALGETVTVDLVGASITQRREAGYRTPAASTDVALTLDLAQYEAEDGPCIAACREGRSHEIEVMSDVDRYAHFAGVAGQHGVRSSLSLPVAGSSLPTALNLYASSPSAFSPLRVRAAADFLGRCVASIVATAPPTKGGGARSVSEHAVVAQRRELILKAQAVMVRDGAPNETAAFTALTRQSRLSNRSVFAVAQEVVDRGFADPSPEGTRS
jgi:hypothetical protein